jgi:L-threonylcarbamoyladenylate synthase
LRIVTANENGINEAADTIKSGGLVAMPTETVYGLAADAFNAEAVARIYDVKRRPSDNPLILHISEKSELSNLTEHLSESAKSLINHFWPGPLTLVVQKKANLPPWLGSHPHISVKTLAVRMPNHPTAIKIIKTSGCVIAAPSANKAGTPSPTCARHIINDYMDITLAPDLLVDDGTVDVGVESTVIDVTGEIPVILRPGVITAEMISKLLGGSPGTYYSGAGATIEPEADDVNPSPRSPGTKYRHYAPKAPMTLLSGTAESIASYITTQIISELNEHIGVFITPRVLSCINKNWGLMSVQSDDALYTPMVTILPLGDSDNTEEIARNLFANLRKFDEQGVDIILAEALEPNGLGTAIMDRMTKAAEGRLYDTLRMYR